jgi:excinuclease ABC subunit C
MGAVRPLVGTKPASVSALGTDPGVYRFRDAQGKVLYIGRAVNLRRRVSSYWGELRGRRHLLRMVAQIDRVEAVACDSEHEAAWLERNLLERSKPRWNRTAGGQETPVYIRLERSAGLKLAYDGGTPGFGPYLGSLKVRTAISGLHRVLPLDYTGARLTGSERDMARLRSASDGADRDALADRLRAVLDRDTAAVATLRDDLIRRRDTAAETLAFEYAARLQTEIEAIDWVCAPQRVTVAGGPDSTVVGWADGMSARFTIRNGRMDGWTLRPSRTPPAAAIAATPPEWAAFAQRNAALAARLGAC